MIKTDTVSTSITEQRRISQAVSRIMHIPVAIHLKPVDILLLRQTKDTSHRREDDNPLLQLVKTELYIVVDHTMIADAALIHIGMAMIIRDVMPHRYLVLWFNRPHIQAGIIRSRGEVLLGFYILYGYQHTG
jgi:hypothetical protein